MYLSKVSQIGGRKSSATSARYSTIGGLTANELSLRNRPARTSRRQATGWVSRDKGRWVTRDKGKRFFSWVAPGPVFDGGLAPAYVPSPPAKVSEVLTTRVNLYALSGRKSPEFPMLSFVASQPGKNREVLGGCSQHVIPSQKPLSLVTKEPNYRQIRAELATGSIVDRLGW